jgi:hypothetical protein
MIGGSPHLSIRLGERAIDFAKTFDHHRVFEIDKSGVTFAAAIAPQLKGWAASIDATPTALPESLHSTGSPETISPSSVRRKGRAT